MISGDKEQAFSELMEIAADAIMSALEDGERHGYNGEWRRRSLKEHLDHANEHAYSADLIVNDYDLAGLDLRTEVTHAMCRLAMGIFIERYGLAA